MPAQTLKRLKHPVREYQLDKNGRSDLARLLDDIPEMRDLRDGMQRHAENLKTQYQHYITTTSLDYMAASLPSSAALCSLADISQARSMVDLGSGFSSYVLRQFSSAQPNPPTVHSVDDSDEWLQKTREYLRDNGLTDQLADGAVNSPVDNQVNDSETSPLLTWEQMQSAGAGPFDLIFHDMGNMALRAAALPWVIENLQPGGFVLLDDTHKSDYRQSVETIAATTAVSLYSLRELTLDKLGRFAMLMHKPV